jgi:hypothetical protein
MKIQPFKTDNVQLPSRPRPKAAAGADEPKGTTGQQKAERKERLKEALMREPAVRPEVVERARKLAADPDYPSVAVLTKIAEKFVNTSKRAR